MGGTSSKSNNDEFAIDMRKNNPLWAERIALRAAWCVALSSVYEHLTGHDKENKKRSRE